MGIRLRSLSPFGPIFEKELRTTARRKRTYLLRTCYLLVLLLVMFMVYLDSSDRGASAGAALRAQRAAELGHTFFVAFAIFSTITLALISPVLTATAIGAERLHRTMDVLLMTPITSWQIVSGKLFSRLLVSLTLIGLSLPVLAVVRLLGGVELGQMVGVLVLCVSVSLFCAAVGLFYSTLLRRAYAVILLSYATLLFLYVFVPMIVAMVGLPHGTIPERAVFTFIGAINPVFSAAAVAVNERGMRHVGFVPCAIVHLSMTALLVLCCGLLIRRLARRQGEGGKPAPLAPQDYVPFARPATIPEAIPAANGSANGDADASAPVAAVPPPLPYAPPALQHRRQVARREVSDNPVLWREIRRPLTTRRWQAITCSLILVACLGISYLAVSSIGGAGYNALGHVEPQIGYAFGFNALLMLLVCVLSGTVIAGEKESDTWDALLATPLSASAIVYGKLLGIGRRMFWPMVLVAAHFTLFALCGALPLVGWLMIMWVLLKFNTVWAATGLYLSLRCRKTTVAVILNLLLPVAAYAGVPIVLGIFESLFVPSAGHSGTPLSANVCWYLPYGYLACGLEALGHTASGSAYLSLGRENYWLPAVDGQVSRATFFGAVVGGGLVHLLVTWAITRYTTARFDAIVGRSPQRNPVAGARPAVA